MTHGVYRTPPCEHCGDLRAEYRGAYHEGMHPDDPWDGIPLPDGTPVTWLCDTCYDALCEYWRVTGHLEIVEEGRP